VKRILRSFIVEAGVLYLVSQITRGLVFQKGAESLIIAAVALSLATFLVKPIINILLLPINLITFGIFRWLSQAVTLFLVDLVLTDFSVNGFAFAGFSNKLFYLPAINVSSVVLAYVLFSFVISLFSSIIHWILK
jgi:putative membrane protein